MLAVPWTSPPRQVPQSILSPAVLPSILLPNCFGPGPSSFLVRLASHSTTRACAFASFFCWSVLSFQSSRVHGAICATNLSQCSCWDFCTLSVPLGGACATRMCSRPARNDRIERGQCWPFAPGFVLVHVSLQSIHLMLLSSTPRDA